MEQSDEQVIGSYFHVLNDLERIGDHAQNFYELSQEMVQKELSYSQEAREEIASMCDTLMEMFAVAKAALHNLDFSQLPKLTEYENKMDDLKDSIRLQSYAQRDPVNEYRLQGADMFDAMVDDIRDRTTRMILSVSIKEPEVKRGDNCAVIEGEIYIGIILSHALEDRLSCGNCCFAELLPALTVVVRDIPHLILNLELRCSCIAAVCAICAVSTVVTSSLANLLPA